MFTLYGFEYANLGNFKAPPEARGRLPTGPALYGDAVADGAQTPVPSLGHLTYQARKTNIALDTPKEETAFRLLRHGLPQLLHER